MNQKLTRKVLKRQLKFNYKNGLFYWKIIKVSNTTIGSIAGYKNPDGYIQIGINGNVYLAHRLAWLYVYGYFPENDLDHKDRIRHHNWIDNLREVSHQCNLRNTGNFKHNKSGVKGVFWNIKKNKWESQITINKKAKYLGRYTDFDNAVCARLAGEQCLDWSGCDSSSPAYKHVLKLR